MAETTDFLQNTSRTGIFRRIYYHTVLIIMVYTLPPVHHIIVLINNRVWKFIRPYNNVYTKTRKILFSENV